MAVRLWVARGVVANVESLPRSSWQAAMRRIELLRQAGGVVLGLSSDSSSWAITHLPSCPALADAADRPRRGIGEVVQRLLDEVGRRERFCGACLDPEASGRRSRKPTSPKGGPLMAWSGETAAGRVEFRCDGPHSDDYTAEVARAVAEGVRVLNHATGSHAGRGLTCPQTVYTVAGCLGAAAAGLGQLLRQLSAFLEEQAAAGRLADDSGACPGQVAARAGDFLEVAGSAAADLAYALCDVQSAVGGLCVPDVDAGEQDAGKGAGS
jgi:hypothetical protein